MLIKLAKRSTWVFVRTGILYSLPTWQPLSHNNWSEPLDFKLLELGKTTVEDITDKVNNINVSSDIKTSKRGKKRNRETR